MTVLIARKDLTTKNSLLCMFIETRVLVWLDIEIHFKVPYSNDVVIGVGVGAGSPRYLLH